MDQSSAVRAAIARKTFLEYGTERLLALAEALGEGGEVAVLLDVFRKLLSPWGRQPIGERPRCPSNVADDGAPFEFSIALSEGTPELQLYVDVQGEPPSARSNMLAGRARLESIASELGASLERLREVEDLFFPEQPGPPFALWIGASASADQRLRLKAYLNPHVQRTQQAFGLVPEAMRRLGFGRCWSGVHELLAARKERDEAGIVSLDLWNGSQARVKLYVRHRHATVAQLDGIARIAHGYQSGDVARFFGALAAGSGPFRRKPVVTELAFVDPRADRPASITLEFPIGSYVGDDQVAAERIQRCLSGFGLCCEAYTRAVHAFATRPLAERGGMHAHVTLRRMGGRPRVGVYFASEAYVAAATEGPA